MPASTYGAASLTYCKALPGNAVKSYLVSGRGGPCGGGFQA